MKCSLAVLLLFAGLAGCSGPCADAEKLVRAYNEASINAYRTGDVTRLSLIADEKELRKIKVLLDIKRREGLVLESEMKSLEVTSCTQPAQDSMTVETRERWRYFDRPIKPGIPAGKVFMADMELTYMFRRMSGAWKVGQVKAVSTRYSEPAK